MKPGQPIDLCGAKTRNGGTCGKTAGWGTDLAVGRCRLHGGASPNGRKHAANELARVMGEELDIEPHEALLQCVRMAAGEVAYASSKVAELEDATVSTMFGPKLDIWVTVRQQAMDRLATYSKIALAAGVAERQVQVAERYGDLIASLIRGILGELHLTAAQQKRAPEIVRTHLALLEGGRKAG